MSTTQFICLDRIRGHARKVGRSRRDRYKRSVSRATRCFSNFSFAIKTPVSRRKQYDLKCFSLKKVIFIAFYESCNIKSHLATKQTRYLLANWNASVKVPFSVQIDTLNFLHLKNFVSCFLFQTAVSVMLLNMHKKHFIYNMYEFFLSFF